MRMMRLMSSGLWPICSAIHCSGYPSCLYLSIASAISASDRYCGVANTTFESSRMRADCSSSSSVMAISHSSRTGWRMKLMRSNVLLTNPASATS